MGSFAVTTDGKVITVADLPKRCRTDVRRIAVSANHIAVYGKHPEYDHFEVMLIDRRTGKLVGELLDAHGAVLRVTYPFYMYGDRPIAFAPDGKTIATVLDSDITIHDVATRKEIRRLEPHGFHTAVDSDDNEFEKRDAVCDLAHDGTTIVSLAQENTLVEWDATTGARRASRTLPALARPLALSTRMIVTRELRAFDLEGRELPRARDVDATGIEHIAISHDGAHVAAVTKTGTTVHRIHELWPAP